MYLIFSRTLGNGWSVETEVMDAVEEFTCLMYGYAREKSVDSVRSIMLKKMVGEDERMTTKSKVDLSRLPPCKNNLTPHVQRVNHRLANFKRAHIANANGPKPHDPDQGWEKTANGVLEPIWTCGLVLPPSLVDLLVQTVNEELEDEEVDETAEEIDFDDFLDDE